MTDLFTPDVAQTPSDPHAALKSVFGFDDFRPGQEQVVRSVLSGRDVLAERRAASRARLKARIDRGLREGELPRGTHTAALADFYATILSGMSLQARDGASRRRLMATVESAMRAWPDGAERASRRVKHARKAAKSQA